MINEEYKKLTKEEVADILLSLESPVIAMHKSPDGDAVGTAKALSVVFDKLGKEWGIICDDKIPEKLQFIFGDEVPEYTVDTENHPVVCVDIASPSQLGDVIGRFVNVPLMIDHHEIGEPFADNYIIPGASSASEVLLDVIEVLENRGLIKMDKELASPLYTAISSDTGCFCYSNVTPNTMRKAADLIEYGIDFAEINHNLFNTRTLNQLRGDAFVAGKIESAKDGKISYVTISKKERDDNKFSKEDLDRTIDIVRTLKGAEVAFAIKENDKGEFKVSLRSIGPDVAVVAKEFGGGGHTRASGCAVDAKTIDEAKKKLISVIEKLCY